MGGKKWGKPWDIVQKVCELFQAYISGWAGLNNILGLNVARMCYNKEVKFKFGWLTVHFYSPLTYLVIINIFKKKNAQNLYLSSFLVPYLRSKKIIELKLKKIKSWAMEMEQITICLFVYATEVPLDGTHRLTSLHCPTSDSFPSTNVCLLWFGEYMRIQHWIHKPSHSVLKSALQTPPSLPTPHQHCAKLCKVTHIILQHTCTCQFSSLHNVSCL